MGMSMSLPSFSGRRNTCSRRCRTYTAAHRAAPSVPSCSSSRVPQTSCCRRSRCCISQATELIDQIVQIRVLPSLGIIAHATQDILRMRAEVGAVAVVAGNQVAGQVRNRHNAGILRSFAAGAWVFCLLGIQGAHGRRP